MTEDSPPQRSADKRAGAVRHTASADKRSEVRIKGKRINQISEIRSQRVWR